jgi:hypothetical protein
MEVNDDRKTGLATPQALARKARHDASELVSRHCLRLSLAGGSPEALPGPRTESRIKATINESRREQGRARRELKDTAVSSASLEPTGVRLRALWWLQLIGTAAVSLGAPVALRAGLLPSGLPGEWTWGVLDHGWSMAVLGPAAISAPVLAGLFVLGRRWNQSPRRSLRTAAYGLGVLATLLAQTCLQILPPEPHNLAKWPVVLYYPMTSGYYTAAQKELRKQSVREFLRTYPQFLQSQPDPFHLATHPPGLMLLHHGAWLVCRTSPALTRALLATEPAPIRTGYRMVRPALPPEDRASLTLAAYLALATIAVTFVPILLLARRLASPDAAWTASAFWWFVPAAALFCPKSDVFYPCFTAVSAYLALQALSAASGLSRAAWSIALGGILWLGACFSVALFVVACMILVFYLLSLAQDASRRTFASHSGLWALATFTLLVVASWLVGSCDLPSIWYLCFQRHAEFYERIPRSYMAWLLLNPVEFSLAMGFPLSMSAAFGVLRSFRAVGGKAPKGRAPALSAPRSHRAAALIVAFAVTWMLLNVSGKNRAEVARLWLFWASMLPPAAALGGESVLGIRRLRLYLVLQALAAVLLVNAVQGFLDPASLSVATVDGPVPLDAALTVP